jgi:adenosylmethionine-8-amino-7-oxononanoate aminotransferase
MLPFTEISPTHSLLERDRRSVWHPYTQHQTARDPLTISSGKGAYLFDTDGRPYLDMISSWWVNIHGHGCEELASAIHEQALKLDHVHFAGVTHEPAVQLAENLLEMLHFNDGRVFFSDNGSTAVEVALKICSQFWVNAGRARSKVLVLRGGYHGDTVGAMSVGGSSGFFNAFRDWLFEVIPIDVPSFFPKTNLIDSENQVIDSVHNILKTDSNEIVALIVEPLIQGASGMKFHTPSFLTSVCSMVQDAGIPVIIDEVMTGFYRTGTPFAFFQANVIPDIVCLSKGITGGILPLGATVVRMHVFDAFLGESFSCALAHGHSFTGNPITCAAAIANIELLKRKNALSLVAKISEVLAEQMFKLEARFDIENARVLGGIAAFELRGASCDYGVAAGAPLLQFAQQKGVIIRPLGNTVYLMPPYCVTKDELNLVFDVIGSYLESYAK